MHKNPTRLLFYEAMFVLSVCIMGARNSSNAQETSISVTGIGDLHHALAIIAFDMQSKFIHLKYLYDNPPQMPALKQSEFETNAEFNAKYERALIQHERDTQKRQDSILVEASETFSKPVRYVLDGFRLFLGEYNPEQQWFRIYSNNSEDPMSDQTLYIGGHLPIKMVKSPRPVSDGGAILELEVSSMVYGGLGSVRRKQGGIRLAADKLKVSKSEAPLWRAADKSLKGRMYISVFPDTATIVQPGYGVGEIDCVAGVSVDSLEIYFAPGNKAVQKWKPSTLTINRPNIDQLFTKFHIINAKTLRPSSQEVRP